MGVYSATYEDSRGKESISISNDGKTLRTNIRGIEFSGRELDSLSPLAPLNSTHQNLFAFHLDSLCSCRFECLIPIPVYSNGTLLDGVLDVKLDLGVPNPPSGLDREDLSITLRYGGNQFSGAGNHGFFELELLDIQKQLPNGDYMKACINCLYSDYSPAGQGCFGGMLCFRNQKAAYLKVKSKADFWPVHANPDRQVQETYLCPEFERRIPGTGYRG